MTALSSAWLAWDRAVALGADATAEDWSAVADAWRACVATYGEAAAARVECAERRAAAAADRAYLDGAAWYGVGDML